VDDLSTPLVIVSHPDAIRALYGERGHHMPPGRQVTLKPLVGARSLLLLEGREHIERRRVMLPPFRGDRMREYEPTMREVTERELYTWPTG
jgi:cytochrome P450